MSIIQQLLLKFPFFILGFIIIGGAVAFSISGLILVRYFFPHSKLKVSHEVANPIFGALRAIYAVLLAFVVVTVWQNFEKSNSNVQQEANYLADIYRDAEAFSPEFRQQAYMLLREYRQAVVEDEWRTMARGKMSSKVEGLMRKIFSLYSSYQPKNPAEQSFFSVSVQNLNSFRDLRRQRLMDSRTGINALLWFVLIAGALLTISFTFLFGAESLKAQIIMVVMLSMILSLILFAVIEMDFPFTGKVSISSAPFKQLLLD